MEVTEEVLSVGLSDSNPRKRKWSEVEETTLIKCVVEREGDLFGDTKGIGLKKKSAVRRESWEDICDYMNSQFSNTKRDVDEIKKKYFTLKQRAKEKIDAIKRSARKTGGGPAPPSLTPAEEAMARTLEGRPVSCGIAGGIDTDASLDLHSPEKEIHTEERTLTTECSSEKCCSSGSKQNEKRKSRQSTADLNEITKENIRLDNKRLELEIMKLEKERERIDEELSYIQIKKLYLKMKIQSEFHVLLDEQ